MTNCSPASLRSRWCARQMRLAGRPSVGDGACDQEDRRGAALLAHRRRRRAPSTTSRADLAQAERMLRLLQGDVGSGKTVVALLAAATVIEAGRQAALMAPTEILARQHLKTIAPLAEAAGMRVAILTGRERGQERADILARLAARRARSPGRHARAVPGRGRVPRSRARHRRRAASLRRAPAPRARPQGRGGRRAGADRDADPAHAGADLFRRHGRLAAAREAGRAASRSTPARSPLGAHRRGRRRRSAARWSAASGSTGSARWSRSPR